MVPFRLNRAQRYLRSRLTGRDIILKARRLGVSTMFLADHFHSCLTEPGTASTVISHEDKATQRLFAIVHRFLRYMPKEMRPTTKKESAKELFFSKLDTTFYCGTAGMRAFGHGDTIDKLHCSELARWPGDIEKVNDLWVGLTEAAAHAESVTIESTANGMGGKFHEVWMDSKEGRGLFTGHFLPWWFDEPSMVSMELDSPGELGELEADERQLMDEHGITLEMIKWRRKKQESLKDKFVEQYPENDIDCFLSSGRPFFDIERLKHMELICRLPEWEGEIVWDSRKNVFDLRPLTEGRLQVWKHPETSGEYVIGVDTAEGIVGGDFTVAKVLNRRTLEEDAVWRGTIDPDEFADILMALGYYYNTAYVGVECNGHGHTTLKRLGHWLSYPRLHYHQRYEKGFGEPTMVLGWHTNRATRPVLLDEFAGLLRDGLWRCYHKKTVDELMTFVINARGKAEGDTGCNDDCVMASAIAYQMHHESGGYVDLPSYLSEEPMSEEATIREIVRRIEAGQDPSEVLERGISE